MTKLNVPSAFAQEFTPVIVDNGDMQQNSSVGYKFTGTRNPNTQGKNTNFTNTTTEFASAYSPYWKSNVPNAGFLPKEELVTACFEGYHGITKITNQEFCQSIALIEF